MGSVSLQINGPVKDPVISGRITATSGTLNFRNDRYEITRALMDLPAGRNADPIVNIQGEAQIRGYRVTVTLTGPLSKTQFTGPGTNISLGGRLAVGPGGRQTFTAVGQLNLRVLNGLSPDVFTSGVADVAVRVIGTYELPRLTGTASVNTGSVSLLLGNERWTISNLKSVVRFTSNQAQIESLTGTMGGGHVRVSGGARLDGISLAEFLVTCTVKTLLSRFPLLTCHPTRYLYRDQ